MSVGQNIRPSFLRNRTGELYTHDDIEFAPVGNRKKSFTWPSVSAVNRQIFTE